MSSTPRTAIVVRPYRDADRASLLSVWRRALPFDALTEESFVRRVLLDENREPEGLLVAEAPPVEGHLTEQYPEGGVAGFALCLVLRRPIENIGLLEHRGFITAMGVAPEHRGIGVGSALLEAAEAFFRERGRQEVAIAPYAPNYFVPGVDKAAYAEGLAWLERRGFEEFSEGIAMDAPIGTFDLDSELLAKETSLATEGLRIEPLGPDRTVAFLDFMSATMPGDWLEDARALLGRMAAGDAPRDSVYVAVDSASHVKTAKDAGGEIVGYCKFAGEHFGPFGVADSHQGRGIGTVLLARTLLQMRLEGHHAAYVLWTGERAAQGVYARLGFTVSRRFAIVKKGLDECAS